MCLELEKAGIPIERQHHEVATAGQAEIDIRFAPLKRMGDCLQYYKYIVRNVAKRHNKTVTFMPKPLFGDNGSGMHTHMSLWNGRQAALCRQRLRRVERHGALFHRRNFETRARAYLHYESDNQQLQATRSRIRSAGQSCLLRAQSFGRDPHSDLFGESESEANRVPHARSRRRTRISRSARFCLPVSMESRTGSILAIRSTKIFTNFRRKNWRRSQACPIHSGARSKRSRPTTIPPPRRRVQCRLHRQLDRHETKRIRRAAATAAPVRIPDVLRRIVLGVFY